MFFNQFIYQCNSSSSVITQPTGFSMVDHYDCLHRNQFISSICVILCSVRPSSSLYMCVRMWHVPVCVCSGLVWHGGRVQSGCKDIGQCMAYLYSVVSLLTDIYFTRDLTNTVLVLGQPLLCYLLLFMIRTHIVPQISNIINLYFCTHVPDPLIQYFLFPLSVLMYCE